MTNLEALQSIAGINYPMDANIYLKALIDNKIISTEDYVLENERSIDLCFAGILKTQITAVDIKEGGYQVTNADRNAMIEILNGIYAKYGLPLFTVGSKINNASNLW